MQKYSNSVTDAKGRAVKGATVTITTSTGATATIYSDNGVTVKANPIVTGDDGEYSFYAANGRYTITTSATGFVGESAQDKLLYDPAETYAAALSANKADLAASSGSSLVGFLQAGTGGVARTVQDKVRERVSVRDFGAVGDGVTNDTAAIQKAIDYVSSLGGGVVFFPHGTYLCVGLVLASGVELSSMQGSFGYLPDSISGVTLKASATGYIVDTPAGATTVCGVSGINFLGLGAATACVGVRFQNVNWGFVKGCNFRSFADQAILKNAGVACVFEDILILESLLNRTRASKNGALEVTGGTDDFLNRIEANAYVSAAVTSASLYVCAILYAGSNAFITNCVGEFGDIGVHVGGLLNRLVDVRADTNVGHGFEVIGYQNQFSTCYGQKNSQAAANTYDQFYVTGYANLFVNCQANFQNGLAPRYGFNDTFNGETGKNQWLQCISAGAVTAQYSNDAFAGSGFTFGAHPGVRIASTTATPDVTGLTRIALNNAAPTTITNLLGGVNGQIVDIYVADSNTTISSGAGFSLYGGTSMPLRGYETYRFYKDGANWKWEDFRHRDLMSADNGDAAKTLTVVSSEKTQIWKTPLTADRVIALGTAGARSGDVFKVVRTVASTGAFNLSVGALKLLAAGQWADVTFDGSAWVLTAYGAL